MPTSRGWSSRSRSSPARRRLLAAVEVLPDNGWLSSVSCATTRNCWAAGAGSANALTGTANRGASWSTVTSDTTNEVGSVSCLSVSTCVAVTDNGVWVTSDDGGLTPASYFDLKKSEG